MVQRQTQQPVRMSTSFTTWSDFMRSLTDLNHDGHQQYHVNKVTLNGKDITEQYRMQSAMSHSQNL